LSSRYSDSGVDIDSANEAKRRIGKLVKDTWGSEVLSEIGNFGGLFSVPSDYSEPVLVSSVDGVGTKLKVAVMASKHNTVGQDLVNHCVNDILVQGARPLFFLDYIAFGKLDVAIVEELVKGLAIACKENGCALIGGETAEMPGLYSDGEYDLAGAIVGIVEKSRVIDGSNIKPGDRVWAFPSSGLHTNGYSLARKIIFSEMGLGVSDTLPGGGKTVAEELLEVHRSYLPEITSMMETIDIKGIAHITGGGLLENIPRILPEGCSVHIDTSLWDPPFIFKFLMEKGNISVQEMFRVFNMGIGMVVIVSQDEENRIREGKYRWAPFVIGEVVKGRGDVVLIGI